MFYLNLLLAIAKSYPIEKSATRTAVELGKTILFMYKVNGMEQCMFVGFYLLKPIGE